MAEISVRETDHEVAITEKTVVYNLSVLRLKDKLRSDEGIPGKVALYS